jgi:hypothetical protein
VKTSLEIPDDLVRDVKVLAATEGKKLKEVLEESLREHLAAKSARAGGSIREIKPVSVGEVFPFDTDADRLGEMLDARGHRY